MCVNRIVWLLIFFSLFTAGKAAIAQKYLVANYTEENGLPSSRVYSICQDSSGYTWFATRNKIASYDGCSWKYFGTNTGLKSNDFNNIFVDERGKVWAMSNVGGIFIAFFDGEKFNNLPMKSISPANLDGALRSNFDALYVNDKPQLLITLQKNNIFLYSDDEWKTIPSVSGADTLKIYDVKAADGKFYLASDKGLYVLKGEKIVKEYFIDEPENLQIFSLEYEGESGTGKLWALAKNSLGYFKDGRYRSIGEKFEYFNAEMEASFSEYFNYHHSFTPDYKNSAVYGNDFFIYIFNKKTQSIQRLSKKNGLIDNGLLDVFKDRENNLWLATNRGVCKLSSFRFESYDETTGFLENECTAVIERNPGEFVFGHNDGLTIKKDEKIRRISFQPYGLSYSRVIEFEKDRSGNIWFAGHLLGLGKLTPDNSITFYKTPASDAAGSVLSVQIAPDGRIFASDDKYAYEFANGKFRNLLTNRKDMYIRRLYYRKGALYAATGFAGVLKYENGAWSDILSLENGDFNNVFCICFDYRGEDIIGTKTGLCRFDGEKIVEYRLGSEIFDRPVYNIVKDVADPKKIWIGTDFGVYLWDGEKLKNYSVQDGLAGLEINRGAMYFDSFGRLWIGTNRGVSRYFEEYDNLKTAPPILEVNPIDVGGKSYDIADMNYFDYSQNDLSFAFKVISFINEKKNSVEYKLDGFDKEWRVAKSLDNFKVRYPKLPPGTYYFKIKAKNALGAESPAFTSGEIQIDGPYYLKAWFIMAVLGAIGFVAYAASYYTSQSKYKKTLEEEVRSRTLMYERSERRYRQMFQNNNAIMLLVEENDGTIIDANPAAETFYGLSREKLAGAHFIELQGAANQYEYDSKFNEIKGDSEFAAVHVIARGEKRNVKIHLSRFDSESGGLLYAIIFDITQQIRAEAKLSDMYKELEKRVEERTAQLKETLEKLTLEVDQRKLAEKELIDAKERISIAFEREKQLGELKSRFISMISHEYRTPLTVILSSTYLIENYLKIEKPDKALPHLKKIQASVDALTRLLEDVIAYNKTEYDGLQVENSSFDAVKLIGEIVEEARLIDNGKHSVQFETEAENLQMNSDSRLFRNIALNLLLNALKYSDSGKEVRLKLREEDGSAIFEIIDSGCGVEKEEIENIFDPFFRGAKHIGIVPGEGLGLSIVKRGVDRLGGEIEVESEPDKGSIFRVKLPKN